jgi:hypothetical protein
MKDIKEMSPVTLVVIAVVAVALIGFFGYRVLAGPSYPAIPSMKDAYQSIDDMARKSQGDFTKLSPKEQDDLNSFARGHGKQYLLSRYKVLTSGENK